MNTTTMLNLPDETIEEIKNSRKKIEEIKDTSKGAHNDENTIESKEDKLHEMANNLEVISLALYIDHRRGCIDFDENANNIIDISSQISKKVAGLIINELQKVYGKDLSVKMLNSLTSATSAISIARLLMRIRTDKE